MLSEQDIFLSLDVGTTSVKAGLVNGLGQGLAQASREYPTRFLSQTRVEQSAWDWWEAATQAVRRLTAEYPALAKSIRCVSVSSQAPTLFAIDEKGQPVGDGVIWMDQRSECLCQERLAPHKDYIQKVTGNRLNAYFVLPKLLWQKENEPESYKRAWKYLQINGWLVFKLTGRCSIDLSSAALTQTLNIHTLRTEEELFSLFGLDAGKWPEVRGCGEIAGTVTEAAARLWEIPSGIPVAAGCIDGASSPLGLGLTRPGEIFEMSGQSSGIGVILPAPEFHPNLCLMKHALPGLWLQKGSMSCSGGSLKWFRDQIDGCPGASFQEYSRLAESSAPGAHGVTFLPYLCGERAPLWDRTLRGMFFGLGLDTGKADLVRAVMEGAAFALRTILDEFRLPQARERILLGTGGGYRSRIWSQIKSDVLNCTIQVWQTDFDAALRGNALLAMQALGCPLPANRRLLSEHTAVYRPDPRTRELYELRYQHYLRILRANRTLFMQNEVLSCWQESTSDPPA